MEDLIETNEPLNPYAKAFFGLWALVTLLFTGSRFIGTIDKESVKNGHSEVHVAQATLTKQVSSAAHKTLMFADQMHLLKTK